MIALTILLILLYFRPIRKLIFGIADRYKIGEGPIYNTIFWIIFAVIAIILIDSVLTYWAIRETLEIDSKDLLVDNFDTIKANQHDDYIIIYKKLREYYMAERNFMLTSSTLFVMFVFKNFLSGFRKIYDNEQADDVKVKAN